MLLFLYNFACVGVEILAVVRVLERIPIAGRDDLGPDFDLAVAGTLLVVMRVGSLLNLSIVPSGRRVIRPNDHICMQMILIRLAVENGVTMFTSLDTVRVLLDVLEEMTIAISTIDKE